MQFASLQLRIVGSTVFTINAFETTTKLLMLAHNHHHAELYIVELL